MTSVRWFQALTLAFYGLATVLLVGLSIRAADGHLIYTLDDPYIHLAVAENVLQGGYGVNATEFSSPSSSILYPFLLAALLALGIGTWAPLVVGVTANFVALWLMAGFFWRHLGEPVSPASRGLLFASAPLLVLSVNALGLPMTGMEHPLHVLGVVLTLVGLADLVKRGRVPLYLVLGILLGPLVRFEGMALSLATLVAMICLRKWNAALLTGFALVAVLGTYAATMHSLGLPLLPSSVLVKSQISAAVIDNEASSFLLGLVRNVITSLHDRWGTLFVVTIGLMLFSLGSGERGRLVMAGVVGAALAAHVLFGRYGWFGRYEVYAVAAMILAVVYLFGRTDTRSGQVPWQSLGVLVLLGAVCFPYLDTTRRTPFASRNIYEQQYQMHRFATEYFPHPVAVNDLGWVAYGNDAYVLDLWGLGSEEARRFRQTDRPAEGIRRLVQERSVDFAMVYDTWLGEQIPPEWCRIAVLKTSQVTTASSEVAFYLVDGSRRAEMREALKAFAPTLPSGASLDMAICDG